MSEPLKNSDGFTVPTVSFNVEADSFHEFNLYFGEKGKKWLRGLDLNQRPLGYEPNELPGCSTPRIFGTKRTLFSLI